MDVREYFLNRPDDFERSEYGRLYAFISEHIPESELRFLLNVSFVMLKPNAYLEGQIPALIDALRQEAVYVFRHKLKILTESELDQLYMFVKRRYSESWWVMERVYSLAPCFLALVIGPQNGFAHLSGRIRELVGPTTPMMGSENKLRYAFRGTHRIFNTIHATDDPASAVREALVFFDIDDIKQAVNASASEEITIDKHLDWSALLPERKIELNYNLAKNQLKRLLLEAAADILANSMNTECAILDRLVQRLDELVAVEQNILDQKLPLRMEYEELRMILHLESLVLALMVREGKRILSSRFRNDQVVETNKEDATRDMAKILEITELMFPLADDVVFMSLPDFEVYLGKLLSKGIRFDPYVEVLLLAGWAAAYNELLDIGLDWPISR